MVWSSITPKWPIVVIFCGMDHQKSKLFTDIWYHFCQGCWGQCMLVFWKLVDETQISKPQKYTNTFKQTLTCLFLAVRVNLKEAFQYEVLFMYLALYTVKCFLCKESNKQKSGGEYYLLGLEFLIMYSVYRTIDISLISNILLEIFFLFPVIFQATAAKNLLCKHKKLLFASFAS